MRRFVRHGIASDTLAVSTCQPSCDTRQSEAFVPRQGLLKRAPRLFEHAGQEYGHRGTIGMILKGTGFRSETAEIMVVEEVPRRNTAKKEGVVGNRRIIDKPFHGLCP